MFEISLLTLWLFGGICFAIGFILAAAFSAGHWKRSSS